jgi:peptidoglycan LD-endopeptidase LytH
VGQPRSYSDTWGAPRSGGRRHMGTDIMAPRGTPIYAYESGTVTRLWNSRLGGISLYLRGDSGNQYFYTHLQGYVSGLSAGQRVSAGQHIAFNGDTGNARGIPHLHFEVMPGGGGNVNPYPYVVRACG